jgi:hypothetical protein
MLTKNDFDPADWKTLRDTQFLVGFGMVLAGASGLGTVKELIALSQGIMENQSSSTPLIRDLTSRESMQDGQASLKASLGGAESKPTPEKVRQLALEQVRTSMTLLGAKATPAEKDAYGRMVYGLAEKVAKAAKEGGFLGVGGTLVSENERAFLNELADTLQLTSVGKA